jgi:hypothetical protein
MFAGMRTTYPVARRVTPMFILQLPFNDKNLFTAKMAVKAELCTRSPPYQSSMLGLKIIQWQNRQTGHQTRLPLRLMPITTNAALIVWIHMQQFDKQNDLGE